MSYENLVERIDEGILWLTINRPRQLNSLNRETLLELIDAIDGAAKDPDVKVVILTGAGERSFVAGADISYMRELDVMGAREFSELGHALLDKIEMIEKPVIAAVNGYALGGGFELALSCDLVFATEDAQFGQPEVKLGLIPGFGGCQRLPRLIGRYAAKQIIFTGETISADRAKQLGIVADIFGKQELMDGVREVAKKIMKNGPLAVRQAKRVINRSTYIDMNATREIEINTFATLFSTADAKEGMSAFLSKKEPQFRQV